MPFFSYKNKEDISVVQKNERTTKTENSCAQKTAETRKTFSGARPLPAQRCLSLPGPGPPPPPPERPFPPPLGGCTDTQKLSYSLFRYAPFFFSFFSRRHFSVVGGEVERRRRNRRKKQEEFCVRPRDEKSECGGGNKRKQQKTVWGRNEGSRGAAINNVVFRFSFSGKLAQRRGEKGKG